MYFDDHFPPHFHAIYQDKELLVNINTLAIISGEFPSRALGLVIEWASLHQEELKASWENARDLLPLGKIAPLE